ncbi:hypothetical protein [Roseimicrobium sp. ORNL1]|uniref:hypothetical protein n=1 Tax=Roseimicrobium sp. ORNL1 TaxID=2711231 RepID=UPI0013E1000A|nr:hypothetical protein [Roseimicrobium sp. ORNL1]QIF02376.1 hypothetical protein G5S37_12865 [Roseimicrobium sp. ORNL1]
MFLSELFHSAFTLALLAISQVELHRERVKEANESFLFIGGSFAVMIAVVGYMGWCSKDAEKRVRTWAQREGFELLDFDAGGYGNRQTRPLCIICRVKVKDVDGVVRTGSIFLALGIFAFLTRRIKVKWDKEASPR